jgi:hypothetical protein
LKRRTGSCFAGKNRIQQQTLEQQMYGNRPPIEASFYFISFVFSPKPLKQMKLAKSGHFMLASSIVSCIGALPSIPTGEPSNAVSEQRAGRN